MNPLLLVTLMLLWAVSAQPRSLSKAELMNLRFEQKLNTQVPLGLMLTNEFGAPVQLREYFDRRPVILVLGYYGCPMLCGMTLNGVTETLQELKGSAGKDFDLLFVSIDPKESPALAAAKKRSYVHRYARPGAENGWHFLVGDTNATRRIADAVGFQFAYDAAAKQYAHPAGIVVLTPEGTVSKYFFGVSYSATEVSTALKQASARGIGTRARDLLILCFKHMPLVGKNSSTIMVAVRALAALTVFALAGFIVFSRKRDRGVHEGSAPAVQKPEQVGS